MVTMTAAPAITTAAPSHPFTCNTCQVAFKSSELQRSHMQTDWHRYNLKRRVASLPPLTSEIFAEKVLANQASAAATAAKASFEKVCTLCQRTYFSENAYQNHLNSQKHRARVLQWENGHGASTEDDASSMMSSAFSLGEPIDTKAPAIADPVAEEEFSKVIDGIKNTSVTEKDPVVRRPTRPHHSAGPEEKEREEHPLSDNAITPSETPSTPRTAQADPLQTCLFCNLYSNTMDLNLAHMSTVHSMFIPEREYLVDIEGLIRHLHDLIHVMHECLYCGQVRRTATGAQTHMRDKGHCKIAFETESEQLEVGEYYDFRSTYSDGEDEDMDDEDEETEGPSKGGGVKLGAKRNAQYVSQAEEDDEWESDEDEDMSEPDGTQTPTVARPLNGSNLAYVEDHELHLPSGRTAGHRSLARFYRQNLHGYPTAEERANRLALTNGEESNADEAKARGRQLVSRANGGLGMVGVADSAKRQAKTVELQNQKRQQRQQTRYQWGNEKRGNQQKHFRDPLLQ